MSVADSSLLALDDSFVRDLEGLCIPWQPAPVPSARLLALNETLAEELGLDASSLRAPEGVAALLGGGEVDGATPVAQAYAGHQFGAFSPRLGDGRALLLGEIIDEHGRRRDVHLKGSGRTPFARAGDGKAAVGPMLREYLIGEAMHALSIPTTRALAVIATGEDVVRETRLPGAVLVRVAASHIRVGTFQFAAVHEESGLLRRLADYSIARHYPEIASADNPYLEFLKRVVDAQASLIARWMLVGFVHGVMNTDNVTISGETMDYGPCAFMETYDPATTFSSTDQGGRYAYGNQPGIAQWNLARLAETLLGLIDEERKESVTLATEVLQGFATSFEMLWRQGMRAKLGIVDQQEGDAVLIDELLALLHAGGVDFTACFRALSSLLRGEESPARLLFGASALFDAWEERWRARLRSQGADPRAVAAAMDRVNPMYIPRNHRVEEALSAAMAGDLTPFGDLLDVVSRPFEERRGLTSYAVPAPPGSGAYRTYCGT